MKEFDLPTRKQCFRIIKQHHAPHHILTHCSAVAKLAVFPAEGLKQNAIAVNVDLIDTACLLHDTAGAWDFAKRHYRRFNQTVTQDDNAKWKQIRAAYKHVRHEDAAYDFLRDKYREPARTLLQLQMSLSTPAQAPPRERIELLCHD